MRRIAALLFCFILTVLLACPAFAASTATGTTLSAAVSSDGSCQITVDIQLHLESPSDNLTFPLPRNAKGVTLNGTPAKTSRSGDVLLVKLGGLLGGVTGDFTLRLQYSLPNSVSYNDAGRLMLELPLLSGFSYPIDAMTFTISLPAQITTKPVFSSGYYKQSIETELYYNVVDNTISGTVLNQLKDQESLSMSLEVSDEVFPQKITAQWSIGIVEIGMIVLAVLAVLYWIFFLRCAPFLRRRCTQPPEGCTAGEIPCCLTGRGADLTMMVLSWAQLGYILIHLEDSGRVTLHKRMEMGNERSAFEVRIFRNLFGKRRTVDGTGYHYAILCRKAASAPGDIQDMFRRSSGNPNLFRYLCAGIGLLGGISLGMEIAGDAVLGILLVILLAAFGVVSAWFMQDWVCGLHLRNKFALLLGLGLCAVWLLLGLIAGLMNVAGCTVGAQLLAGLMYAYSGRRTVLGRRIASEILGLRGFLRRLSPQEAKRLLRSDPSYFFTMAPYAIALGVGKPFAAAFGRKQLSACPYLTTGMDGHMSALEWYQVICRAITSLDARQLRMPLERLMGR